MAEKWLFDDARVVAQGEDHNRELDLSIRWRCDGYGIEYRTRQCTRQDDGSFMGCYFDEGGRQEWTDDFDKMERFIDGWIKWDGCSHINFGDENGYLHLCGGRHYESVIWVLRYTSELALKHAEKLDPSCADFPLQIGRTEPSLYAHDVMNLQ
jgi:hypothetical protein